MSRTKELSEKDSIWVIGDLHGYRKTLEALFTAIDPSTTGQDHIVFLGDLVDRGPDVKGCLDFIHAQRKKGVSIDIVCGNHDALMIDCWHEEMNSPKRTFSFLRGKSSTFLKWQAMGGDATLASFGVHKIGEVDPFYIEMLENSFDYIKTEHFLLVHAGFDFEAEDPFEDVNAMRWIREFKVDKAKSGGRKVVHGHTPVSFEFIEDLIAHPDKESFLPLDNGVMIKGNRDKGRLLAYNLKTGKLLVQGRLE